MPLNNTPFKYSRDKVHLIIPINFIRGKSKYAFSKKLFSSFAWTTNTTKPPSNIIIYLHWGPHVRTGRANVYCIYMRLGGPPYKLPTKSDFLLALITVEKREESPNHDSLRSCDHCHPTPTPTPNTHTHTQLLPGSVHLWGRPQQNVAWWCLHHQ